MKNDRESLNTTNTAERTYRFTKKQLWGTIAAIVLLFIVLWVWKVVEVRNLKAEYSDRELRLKQQTADWITQTNRTYLTVLAKPYVWAARKEMLEKNLAQVNLYGNDIVKEKNFVFVMVTDESGTIVATTDKKFENKNISVVASPGYLKTDTTLVENLNDSVMLVASPIMEFNNKLGTLLIKYNVKTPSFIKAADQP